MNKHTWPCEKHSQVIVHLPPAVSNGHGAGSPSHARISSYAHSLATSNEQERIFRRSNMGTLSISWILLMEGSCDRIYIQLTVALLNNPFLGIKSSPFGYWNKRSSGVNSLHYAWKFAEEKFQVSSESIIIAESMKTLTSSDQESTNSKPIEWGSRSNTIFEVTSQSACSIIFVLRT